MKNKNSIKINSVSTLQRISILGRHKHYLRLTLLGLSWGFQTQQRDISVLKYSKPVPCPPCWSIWFAFSFLDGQPHKNDVSYLCMFICRNGAYITLYGCVLSGLSIRISNKYTILPTRERRTVRSTVRTTMMAEVKALMAGHKMCVHKITRLSLWNSNGFQHGIITVYLHSEIHNEKLP